ncbi:MAG: hypothetical protein FJY85_08235, partial [Deltaproteobacteria bacterium]|nr:hypothetical protein [Deltaproteobacteria bacterium]
AMLEKNRGDSGPSTREIILETQNKNLEMMMNMQKANQETMAAIAAKKTDDPAINQMREELRTAREENARTRDDLYKQQLNYLHKEMDDLKSYAYRDDLETMLKQKEKLERLGVVNPTSKDAETKALENSTLLAKEGLNKIDKIGSDMRSLMQPFADAQAALMRAQAQQGRPLSRQNYTEEQRKDAYKKILEKIEEEEGGEE